MDRHTHLPQRLPRSRRLAFALAGLLATSLLCPSLAEAGPRDDMKAAYQTALDQANNLEYDAALATLNNAINTAESNGNGDDPVLASLYLLRAALTFSAEGHGAAPKILADLQRAVSLNYYVVVPMEMRSEDLAAYMQQARQSSGASAPQPITLTEPAPACDAPLHFEVLLSVPDGGQAALYWRKKGDEGEFVGAEMPAFSNVAEIDIPADEHQNADIEYFIYAFDASMNPAANLGLQDQPLLLEQDCKVDEPEETEPEEPVDEPKAPAAMPRAYINLGVGTGFGVAGGTAANTYRQFFPRSEQIYGAAEAGCAIARWVAGTREVTEVPGAELLQAFDTFGAPGMTGQMMMEFNPEECAEHHPVSTGMASAPFHIAPEIAFAIGKKRRAIIGVMGRLQVVNATNMFRDDPTKDLTTSFNEDVRGMNPQGIKQSAAFAFGVGASFKYLLGKDEWKFKPYVGGFAGGGFANLRVDMGFANDRNGNSVPDNLEIGVDTDAGGNCYPVWPYNASCGNDANAQADQMLATNVAGTTDASNRVDVVRIGPFFAGATVGFNYQIHKNFALFGEVDLGVYLPNQTSFLIDINLGPAITF